MQHTPFEKFGETVTIARGAFAGRQARIVEWAEERLSMPWHTAAFFSQPLACGFQARYVSDPKLFNDVNRTKYNPLTGDTMKTLTDPLTKRLVEPPFDGRDIVVAQFADGVEVLVHLAELE